MTVEIHQGDSREVITTLAADSIDSVVTDPPYALISIVKRVGANGAAPPISDGATGVYKRSAAGFMGKKWDTGETAFDPSFWRTVYRVLKPGGHILAFGGTRTYHRLACAIEDAGFEIRDQIAWLYGSGFPKSHDVSKAIDRAAGVEREKIRVDASELKNPPNLVGGVGKGDDRPWRLEAIERGYHEKDGDLPATAQAKEWQGWGTALKPALEPIVLARKPLIGTVAQNVLRHGTGAINVDGCRIGTDGATKRGSQAAYPKQGNGTEDRSQHWARVGHDIIEVNAGRWPANVLHDGSDEVVAGFPDSDGGHYPAKCNGIGYHGGGKGFEQLESFTPTGSAARFYYTAKADESDRIGSKHPTVKPVDLMQYLCRLITPPGGVVLDPFAGSGSTGEAAFREGFRAILIEREEEYIADIRRRMALALAGPEEKQRAIIKAKGKLESVEGLPLFGVAAE